MKYHVFDTKLSVKKKEYSKIFEAFYYKLISKKIFIIGINLWLKFAKRFVNLLEKTIEIHSEIGVIAQFLVLVSPEIP